MVGYVHDVTLPPDPALETLWVEWTFLSDEPFTGNEICDGTFIVDYKPICFNQSETTGLAE